MRPVRLFEVLLLASFTCGKLSSANGFYGRTLFECPDSFYLSQFGASFSFASDAGRQYFFGCSLLFDATIPNQAWSERCRSSEETSTSNGDLYVGCESNEYAAGVSLVQNGSFTYWSILCCESKLLKIRGSDCVSTSFLNDFEEFFNFKSGRQLIRKWQALYSEEKRDRRWWLQICPADVEIPKIPNSNDVAPAAQFRTRFSRSAGGQFAVSRFFSISKSVKTQKQNGPSSTARPDEQGQSESSDLDYYDYYDSKGREVADPVKKKQEQNGGVNGLLNTAKQFIDDVQGGLFLAKELKNLEGAEQRPRILFSSDAVQPAAAPKNKGALQNMLEFLGLCKGVAPEYGGAGK